MQRPYTTYDTQSDSGAKHHTDLLGQPEHYSITAVTDIIGLGIATQQVHGNFPYTLRTNRTRIRNPSFSNFLPL